MNLLQLEQLGSQQIFRSEFNRDHPATPIQNTLLDDDDVDGDSFKFMSALLRYHPDSELSVDKMSRLLRKSLKLIRKYIKKLIKLGYIWRGVLRDESGRFVKWVYRVFDNKEKCAKYIKDNNLPNCIFTPDDPACRTGSYNNNKSNCINLIKKGKIYAKRYFVRFADRWRSKEMVAEESVRASACIPLKQKSDGHKEEIEGGGMPVYQKKNLNGQDRLKLISEDDSHNFEEFWDAYPHQWKSDSIKLKAKAAYLEALDEKTHEQLIGALRAQNENREKRKQKGLFVPFAVVAYRWLQNKRWRDEVRAPSIDKADGKKMTKYIYPRKYGQKDDVQLEMERLERERKNEIYFQEMKESMELEEMKRQSGVYSSRERVHEEVMKIKKHLRGKGMI